MGIFRSHIRAVISVRRGGKRKRCEKIFMPRGLKCDLLGARDTWVDYTVERRIWRSGYCQM